MTCTLMLMRHAKSDHGDPSLSDHDRPLNRRGRRDAPLMADWMARSGRAPQRVLCSTAVRTRETLDLMLDRWTEPPDVEFCESLYLANPESILWTISGHHMESAALLVMGHNPGISMLASALAQCRLEMPTAAVAVLQVQRKPGETTGTMFDQIGLQSRSVLDAFATPKTLD